ncbi:hypothetical protein CHS0354_026903 [Potamilus streckersoni]|uniref:Uncharacterized protein n=1 Tax=Potamilus streckersoni TaxID=2493646 RepID=A0AAE0SPE3_9BIVA|nr:hypothetical protein CHS0354_026903 [Potamilus streckersoni]
MHSWKGQSDIPLPIGEGDPKIGSARLHRQEGKKRNTLKDNLTNRKRKSLVQVPEWSKMLAFKIMQSPRSFRVNRISGLAKREEVGEDPTLSGPAMSSTTKQKSLSRTQRQN